MLLLTGATGTVGSALLPRLTARGDAVRCLVRSPRGLGDQRVRVQIVLGDLADPWSFRNALRGVDTVVHLAASVRDQPAASIEELNGLATWRLVRAAERAGVRRFVFFSALGASSRHSVRFFRAKALAERALAESSLAHTIFAPSIVYAPGDRWLTLLDRLSLLPVMPLAGAGRALFQPIWAQDAATAVIAVLAHNGDAPERVELAGPDTLSHEAIVALALRSFGRRRPLLPVPRPLVRRGLNAVELLAGPTAFATAEEAELMDVSMTSRRGTADAEALGVRPRPMAEVLG
ncbi:MAG TPA: NAD(P)H-binding protein [Solirubrobacteraceae bacterium]|jgi:NADH dehydrogenase|nr:NAD(P)H-binding protein [Solirubrobacteraceae bacterium]